MASPRALHPPAIRRFVKGLRHTSSRAIQSLLILSIFGSSLAWAPIPSAPFRAAVGNGEGRTSTAVQGMDQESAPTQSENTGPSPSVPPISISTSELLPSPSLSITTRLWAGTNNAGVWFFNGFTWEHRSEGLPGGAVNSLANDPLDHDVLLAIVGGRVYRTEDAGISWSAVEMPYQQTGWTKAFFDRASPGDVVVSGMELGEIFHPDPRAAISKDDGLTWTGIDLPVEDVARADPGDVWGFDGTWYISGDDGNNIVLGWDCHRRVIWKSVDHGDTWQRLCSLNRSRYYTGYYLTGSWDDPSHLFITLNHFFDNPLLESTDGGLGWTEGTQYLNSPRQFLTDPIEEDTLWLVAEGRLFKSSSGINGFQPLLSLGSTLTAAVDGHEGVVYGGGNGRRFAYSQDGGNNWTRADLPQQGPVTSNTAFLSLAAEQPTLLPLSENALWCTGNGDCPVPEASTDATGYGGHPINTRTGDVDYTAYDLSLSTSAGPLSFFRTYASRSTEFFTDTLGFGWTHNHDIRLIFPDDPGGIEGKVLFKARTANRYEFFIKGDGLYRAYPGLPATLAREDGPPVTYTVTDKSQGTYLFDEDGRIMTWSDPQGHTFTYTYNLLDQLATVSADNNSRWLGFEYDADGRLETVRDHSGREVSFAYDAAGDLAAATDVLGQVWTYTYDADHNLTEVIDPRGITVERNEYDAQGRAVRQFNGEDELVVELIYNPDGTTTVIDGRGNDRLHTYDGRDTLVAETDALGATLDKTYDSNFRPIRLVDPAGETTYLDWDGSGANLTTVIDADGQVTQLEYDDLNNLTRVEDARGNVTTYTYAGTLMTHATNALGFAMTNTYTDAGDAPAPEGLLKSMADPLGNTTAYTYDEFGNRISITDALGNTTLYRYDDRGQRIEVEDPLGRVTRTEYDEAGRVVRTIQAYDPSRAQNEDDQYNIITEYHYDEVGNLLEVIDTYGHTTAYEYDDADRLIHEIDPLGNETHYTYDEAGNLLTTTDALGRTTTYEYDEENRRITTSDPLLNTTSTIYNPDGTVASTTNALDRITTYVYDELKRVVQVIDPAGGVTETEYDVLGNVVARIDPLDRTTTYEYDPLNRLARVIDALGGITEYVYNPAGDLTRIIDPNEHATDYVYDELHRIFQTIDALGNTTETIYDAVGNRVTAIDPYGNTTTYGYDALYRLVSTTDPLGGVMLQSYDALGNRLSFTDPNGNATTFAYDPLNRLAKITDALGYETLHTYDPVGNRLTTTDANGNTELFSYDDLNRFLTITDPLGGVAVSEYDPVGNTISSTDANGHTTTYAYDELNRLILETDPLDGETRFGYDPVGNRTSRTDARGNTTTFAYDDLDRLTATTDPLGHTRRTEYDSVGNVVASEDALGNRTLFGYDDLNRNTTLTDPLGNVTRYGYDALGNRISMTDANGVVTGYDYDILSRLTDVVENAMGGGPVNQETNVRTEYGYDPAGNRAFIRDARGNLTTFTYDDVNQAISETDPLGNTTTYLYDGAGNRVRVVDAKGFGTGYTFDALNRLIAADYADPDADVTYSYDSVSNRTSMTDGVGTTQWTYDTLDRVTSVVDPFGDEVTYTYDAVGNRIQLGYPDGKTVDNAFDDADRLIQVTDWDAGVTTYTYDAADRRIGVSFPNGVDSSFGWDSAGRLTTVDHGAGGQDLASYAYAYDSVGNRIQAVELQALPIAPLPGPYRVYLPSVFATGGVDPRTFIDYVYDPLYRLTAADFSTGEFFTYTYDAAGNRLSQTTPEETKAYVYDAANRLIEVDGVGYDWDANGNLLDDGERSYRYDHADRLIALDDPHSDYSFAYNGLGDRLAQTVDGSTTEYSLDLNAGLTQVLAAEDDAYLYGLDRIGETGASGWGYHLPDALGSVRQLTDPGAGLTATQSYDPFGSVLSAHGDGASAYGFAGEWEDDTGLIHLRARYYSPEMGRFFQVDPWQEVVQQLSNTGNYIYASNNPVTHVDPSGLWELCLLWTQKGADKVCILGLFSLSITKVESPPVGIVGGPLIWFPWNIEFSLGCEPDDHTFPGVITPTPGATPTPIFVQSTSQAKRQATPTPTITPDENERSPIRVHLQNWSETYAGILLQDPGDGLGVTTSQVTGALSILRVSPYIPKRQQGNAQFAYNRAVAWVLSRPPAGVYGAGNAKFGFDFDKKDPKNGWRFDIDIFFGHHLTR